MLKCNKYFYYTTHNNKTFERRINMKKERKEVTKWSFKGVSADGSIVFRVRTALHIEYAIEVKLIEYKKGTACIAFDHSVHPYRVAEIVAGSFSQISNLKNIAKIEIAYRNIRLAVTQSEGKRNIISMLMKAFTSADVKEIPVDMKTCERSYLLKDEVGEAWRFWTAPIDTFYFEDISKFGRALWFRNSKNECLVISSLKDGIINASPVGGTVDEFCNTISKCFNPYNNFYGLKGVEIRFNQFSMLVNEQNVNSIRTLYDRCWSMDCELGKQEWEVYSHSPEYIRKRAKVLKKECRHKAVAEKVKAFQKDGEFEVKTTSKSDWEKYKREYTGDYGEAIIRYAILWIQYMEYLTKKYEFQLSKIGDKCSRLADLEGVNYFMKNDAANIISHVWKHGEEFRKCYNAKWNYSGEGTVNPAVLTISA